MLTNLVNSLTFKLIIYLNLNYSSPFFKKDKFKGGSLQEVPIINMIGTSKNHVGAL